jgi:hypothetical protein
MHFAAREEPRIGQVKVRQCPAANKLWRTIAPAVVEAFNEAAG